MAIAGQLVANEGLEGLRMPVLAKKVGISTPALYRHFESKEALVAELALIVMQEVHQALSVVQESDEAPGWHRLAGFCGAYLEMALGDPVTSSLLSSFVTDPRRLVSGPVGDEIWKMAESWWLIIETSLLHCGVSEEVSRELGWGLWTSLQGQLGALKFALRRGELSVRRSASISTFGIVSGFRASTSSNDLEDWLRAFQAGAASCDEARGGKVSWWKS